jgi:hypothetical protein
LRTVVLESKEKALIIFDDTDPFTLSPYGNVVVRGTRIKVAADILIQHLSTEEIERMAHYMLKKVRDE